MRKPIWKRGFSLIIFFFLFLCITGGMFLSNQYRTVPLNAMENKTLRSQQGEDTQKAAPKRASLKSPFSRKCRRVYRNNENLLILVNKEKGLSEDYTPGLIAICNGRLHASEMLRSDLVDMLAAAKDAGYQYWIASAYRSREKQERLISEDIRELMKKGMTYQEAQDEVYKETQPAGHSEHETGLALDILCSENPNMTREQEQEPGNIWLRENSWRYGFILRYPREKEKITKIRFEPWHFRYVGREAAKFMYRHNMTLEELYQGTVPK